MAIYRAWNRRAVGSENLMIGDEKFVVDHVVNGPVYTADVVSWPVVAEYWIRWFTVAVQ